MYILIGLIVFLLISTALNAIMLKVEAVKYKHPGKLIEIDGHPMHITGTGQGRPTVIMTCGSGTPCAYTDYCLIESKISVIARTCVYERPGYGWSSSSSTQRDTEQIVRDLRRLLEKAGEKPPYLFVAHSMGAMEVLLYAHNFPQEVAGIVLIDGTSPYKHIHHPKAAIPYAGVQFIRILNHTGLLRIAAELNLIPLINKRMKRMPKEMGRVDKAMIYKNLLNDMVVKEGESLTTIALKMKDQLDLKNIPLIVFTADSSLEKLPGWRESQNSLLKLSTNSSQIVIDNSHHVTILQEHWEEIANEIKELIYRLRDDMKCK